MCNILFGKLAEIENKTLKEIEEDEIADPVKL
jgi:hypothetical protein